MNLMKSEMGDWNGAVGKNTVETDAAIMKKRNMKNNIPNVWAKTGSAMTEKLKENPAQ